MGRMYTVYGSTAGIAAAADLLEITPAADKPCVLHAIFMSNVGGTSDAGDAQEELLQVGILIGESATNGGASSLGTQVNRIGTVAGAFTARGCTTNTTVASSSVLHSEGWNVRVPYVYIPTPEMRPVFNSAAGSLRLQFRLMQAPADALNIAYTAYIEEL